MINLLSTTTPNPQTPAIFTLFTQRLTQNTLARQYPTPHIHWEIAIFMPPPLPLKKPRKSQKLQLMIKLICTIPLSPKLHLPLSTISPQIHGSTVSNSPNLLRNQNKYFKIVPDIIKKQEYFLTDAPNTDDHTAADDDSAYAQNATDNDVGSADSKNPNIHWENAINISKCPQHQKNH